MTSTPAATLATGAALQVSISRGDAVVTQVTPTDRIVRLGRSAQSDIVLNDLAVSRRHAALTWEAGRPVLADEGSRNGIWRDGRRERRIVLEAGATAVLGPFSLTAEPVPVKTARTRSAESTVVVAQKGARSQPPGRDGR
jgi:pSer/pThr/pTyr-binding forkhead associated (FHA) protein